MSLKRNNRKKVGIREKTASFVSQRQDATLKRSHNETSMKNKYDALKELEKGVPQKEVALRFAVQKSTLSTWKRNKTKIEEAYHAGLGNKRMRPEKYKDLNKALMKWFLNC